ncbi:MAG: hypothetical protein JWO57_1140 [Pseudonocardiales bacterium]|nr:hypothetical protein [Pseudonocardiales bacterium]
MSRPVVWVKYMLEGRNRSLEILGAGYALLLLGATTSASTVGWVQSLGVPIFIVGVALLMLGALLYVLYWKHRGSWADSAPTTVPTDEPTEALVADHGTYRPNYGPGKLPRPGDVEEVIRYAREKIPAALFYTDELLHAYIDVNPGSLRCIRTDRRHTTAITGYYVLLALSSRAEGLIRDGSIDVGVALPPALTIENPIDSDGLYIGMYHAIDRTRGPEITLALTEHLQQILTENGRPMNLYARSGNPSSRSMMDTLKFAPLHGGHVGADIESTTILAGELDEQLARLRKIQAYRERH